MGKKKLPPGFLYERLVPKRWAEDLAQLTPPNDMLPYLILAWMSGDPWEQRQTPNGIEYGVQRWVVYEMVPLRIWWGLIQQHRKKGKTDDEIIEAAILEELQGPHPRDRGYYDEVLDRFISDSLVTKQEWELFHRLKAIPKIFWIIQGSHGGHRRVYDPLEQEYLRMARLPTEPPAPGALPYAEFDQNVLFQLARRQRIKQAAGYLADDQKARDEQLVKIRKELVQWVEDQQRAALEEVRLNVSNVRWSSDPADDPTEAIERRIDRFIQTGSLYPRPEE